MSVNLLAGYEDVASRYNLCPNGAFRINQRGLFASLADAKVGDYILDMWSIYATSADYLQASNETSGTPSSLRLKGRGKKGQYVTILNHDAVGYNYPRGGLLLTATGRDNLTAACLAINDGAVPIKCVVSPRYCGASYENPYSFAPVINGGNRAQSVYVAKTDFFNINTGAQFIVTLQADGEFDVTIRDFVELAGAFRNPPTACPVPYADDLQRCQRYYASGSVIQTLPIYRYPNPGNINYLWATFPFATQMAGTPTMSVVLSSVLMYHLPTTGSGQSAEDYANWTLSSLAADGQRWYYAIQRSIDQTTYPLAKVSFNWIAAV